MKIKFSFSYLIPLALSALMVSTIGATFSVTGLAKLFSGAPLAVMFMAGSLEFAKVVSAGFLHHYWNKLGFALKGYLTIAVVTLMVITSLGIFGFLSHAFQKASVALAAAQVRLDTLGVQGRTFQGEIDRIQAAIDQIPANRISKRIEIQKEMEPELRRLKKGLMDNTMETQKVTLEKQSYETEIGPLVYVAEAFEVKMDRAARWFIIMFVCVFDPLAITLVVATSWLIQQRAKEKLMLQMAQDAAAAASASEQKSENRQKVFSFERAA